MRGLIRRHRVGFSVALVLAGILAAPTIYANLRLVWLQTDIDAAVGTPAYYTLIFERQDMDMFIGWLEVGWVLLGMAVFAWVSLSALHRIAPSPRWQ